MWIHEFSKQDNSLAFLALFCICPLHSESLSPAVTLGSKRTKLRYYSNVEGLK
jgi:hypothetical protein